MVEKTDEVGHTTFWYTPSEVAKIIGMKHDGKVMGRNLFMAMLRQNGVLMSNNFPYQFYLSMGMATMYCVKKWHNHYQPVFSETFISYAQKKIASGEWRFVYKKPTFVKNEVNIDDVM